MVPPPRTTLQAQSVWTNYGKDAIIWPRYACEARDLLFLSCVEEPGRDTWLVNNLTKTPVREHPAVGAPLCIGGSYGNDALMIRGEFPISRTGVKASEIAIMRPIETTEYWLHEFQVTDEDLTRFYEAMVEDGLPKTLKELVYIVLKSRVELDKAAQAQERLASGAIYQPKDHYEVGQKVFFPALGDKVGSVVSVRPGDNPRYGPFTVIRVKFEDGSSPREFASDFQPPHLLNVEEPKINPEDLYRQFGDFVELQLRRALEKHPDFVSLGDLWFLRDLIFEVHVGHLNIAEAIIDLAGAPQPTETLLKEMELPESVPLAAQVFAVNYALSQDERFVNVGTDRHPVWALASQRVAQEAASR